jgi:hypothetical protein
MPDWVTHIVVAWTVCRILGFKFKQFNNANTVIVMIGALIPDLYKTYITVNLLSIDTESLLYPFHTPIGALIWTFIIALFFKEKKAIVTFLILGFSTHFILDSLMQYPSKGIEIFYPFSWNTWQFGIISIDDYNVTILSIVIALSVYLTTFLIKSSEPSKTSK